jgi:hypothetical protein
MGLTAMKRVQPKEFTKRQPLRHSSWHGPECGLTRV